MSCLVAYSDTPAGRDALSVAVRHAYATRQGIDILVVRLTERSTPPLDGYTRMVSAVTDEWLAKAAARARRVLPPERVRTHQRMAESVSQGLLTTAAELGSSLIVVGGASDGVRGRLAVSSLARVLLHSSPYPLVLAPRRIRKLKLSGISRVTVAVPERDPGHEFHRGLQLAEQAGCPLRAVTLVSAEPGPTDGAALDLSAVQTTVPLSAENAVGETVQQALSTITWEPGELLVVGSSRLAVSGRVFLGATAGKILREVPVPVVVVPLAADAQHSAPGEQR